MTLDLMTACLPNHRKLFTKTNQLLAYMEYVPIQTPKGNREWIIKLKNP